MQKARELDCNWNKLMNQEPNGNWQTTFFRSHTEAGRNRLVNEFGPSHNLEVDRHRTDPQFGSCNISKSCNLGSPPLGRKMSQPGQPKIVTRTCALTAQEKRGRPQQDKTTPDAWIHQWTKKVVHLCNQSQN